MLVLEIALTRLFSIYLSYHFAFMVISIAMLGLGSAGTVLSLTSAGKNKNDRSVTHPMRNITTASHGVNSRMAVHALLAGISIIASYVICNHVSFDPVKLTWDWKQIFSVALLCLVFSVPFFFSGMVIATAFSSYSEQSELIYGSDLLGAGTGSLAVLAILQRAGPEYAVLAASVLCCAASLVMGGKRTRFTVVLFIAFSSIFFFTSPEELRVRLSPYKPLSLALKYPGADHLETYYNTFSRIDTLKSPAVRFAPGLSLFYDGDLPEQIGLSIDGGEMQAVTKGDRTKALSFLEFLPSALVYEIKKRQGILDRGLDVLVLEPKGGLQVLMAEQYSHKEIYKFESNPLLVNIIRDDLREFSGGMYERNTWSGLGRSLMKNSQFSNDSSQLFDVIDLPMTGVSPSGAFGITEDYRFTVEAFQEYLNALRQDGIMSISLYILPPPRIELRIVGTVIHVLEQRGVKEVSQHIAGIRSWDSITILVKNTPFDKEEIRHIRDFARDRRFDLLSYPGIEESETNVYIRMPSNEYYQAFARLINPELRKEFQEEYLFNIDPVTDESPFPHFYLKLKNIKAIYDVMGNKWQYFIEEGYLLPVIFLQILLLSLVLILLPVLGLKGFQNDSIPHDSPFYKRQRLFPSLLYFGMLGLGFMFVEVTLIQKSILPLVNPSFSVATVLTAILISSGTGSMMSSRLSVLRITSALPVLIVLIALYSLFFPQFLGIISPYSLKLKIIAVFLGLIPLGFFMGIPFPAGIKLLGQGNRALIPWAWAVNGCLSVLAPILTIMLAMSWGFQTVLWSGAAVYLFAYLALRRMK
ncbi:hypothetical protein EP227_00355 [bacterium]|nr:MAG: hypothetical protein EP227_00355 [bacterium]